MPCSGAEVDDRGSKYSGAQIWHPANGALTPKTWNEVNLFCAGHFYLADGRLFVVGGIAGL